MAGIEDFDIIPPEGHEPDTGDLPPDKAVEMLAEIKCSEVAQRLKGGGGGGGKGHIIIAADTMVCIDHKLLGKPSNESEAKAMLKEMSGKKHTVYTGVAVNNCYEIKCFSVQTDVYFRSMTDREIDSYIATGEPMDKAGAYGAQGKGALFIERIDGDYFNVVGLPLCRLGEILSGMGVNLL